MTASNQTASQYAIIRDGGHQYRVEAGQCIEIERTGLSEGDSVTFDQVLFTDGKVGEPTVDGASVSAVVKAAVKGKKIYVVKYKRRKNYRRRFGHRQKRTLVEITGING